MESIIVDGRFRLGTFPRTETMAQFIEDKVYGYTARLLRSCEMIRGSLRVEGRCCQYFMMQEVYKARAGLILWCDFACFVQEEVILMMIVRWRGRDERDG